jgi:hypothetical protein
MKTIKQGFYFETEKENATIYANGFYFTNKRALATDENHSLSIGKEENWTGNYFGGKFTPRFFCNDAILIENN